MMKIKNIKGGGIMEIKKDFNLRKFAGEYILIPKNISEEDYNGIISLNEVEALVWENLEERKSEEEILSLITNTYMIKKSDARKDLGHFLRQLEKADIIELEKSDICSN